MAQRNLVLERQQRQTTMTRRMMLAAMGAVTVGAGVIVGSTGMSWWNQPPSGARKALSRKEYDVVQIMAEAWMPAGNGPPDIGGAEADCGAFVDEVVSRLPDEQRKLFKLVLHVIDEAPRLGLFGRLTDMDPHEAQPHVLALMNSDLFYLRQGVMAVMALISLAYTTHPEVAPMIQPWFNCGFGR